MLGLFKDFMSVAGKPRIRRRKKTSCISWVSGRKRASLGNGMVLVHSSSSISTSNSRLRSQVFFPARDEAGAYSAASRRRIRATSAIVSPRRSGCGCVALGLVWSGCFPIIKHIWTGSFVLFSAGICFLLLAFFYWLIDVRGFTKWAFPLRVAGMNSIVAYLLTGVTEAVLAENGAMSGGPAAGFLAALGVLSGLWLVLYGMYRKKVFVRI